jgi:hypothetical protein
MLLHVVDLIALDLVEWDLPPLHTRPISMSDTLHQATGTSKRGTSSTNSIVVMSASRTELISVAYTNLLFYLQGFYSTAEPERWDIHQLP